MKATLRYSILLAAASLVLPSCSSQRTAPVTAYPTAVQQEVYVAPVNRSNKISDVERKHRELVRQMSADLQKDIEAEKKEHDFVKAEAQNVFGNNDYQWGHNQLLIDQNRKASELRSYPR